MNDNDIIYYKKETSLINSAMYLWRGAVSPAPIGRMPLTAS